MSSDLMTKLLLLLAGALAGIVSGIVGSAYKNYLERKSESRKSETAVRLEYLYPLLFAVHELKAKLALAYNKVVEEKDITKPEAEMTDRYYLRYWFWKYKEYIVNENANWSDERRKKELSMHSGGVGYGAASTLYATAYYLWHATRIRLRIPAELRGKGVVLVKGIERVRASFSGGLEFYDVTQDSTGASMTNKSGGVRNYREFCEAITDQAERAWFLTLADVYFTLHKRSPANVQKVIESLEDLISVLRKILGLSAVELVGQSGPN
jgi:hypothetical protein